MSSTQNFTKDQMLQTAQQMQGPAGDGAPEPVNPMAPAGEGPADPYTRNAAVAGMALGTLDKGRKQAVGTIQSADKKLGEASQKTQAAVRQQGEAEQAVVNETFKAFNPYLEELTRIDETFRQNVAKARAQSEIQMQKVMQGALDVQKFQFQDFFADKSTMGKVLGVVAQALSGAANGLAGQPGAPTPLDRIIERDMQLQQAKFAKLRAGVEEDRGIMNLLREQLGDEISAQTAFRTALNQKLQITVQQLASKMGVPMEKAQALAAQIAQNTAQSQSEGARKIADILTNNAHAESGVYQQYAQTQTQMDMESQRVTAAAKAKQQELARGEKSKLDFSTAAATEFQKTADDLLQSMNRGFMGNSKTEQKANVIQLAEYAFRAQNPGTTAKLDDEVIHNIAAQAGVRFIPGTNDVAYIDQKAFETFRRRIGEQIKTQSRITNTPQNYDTYRDETDK